MNNLSQECRNLISNQDYSVLVNKDKNAIYRFGMIAALTNPTIYQSAGLMTVEEALRFAEWYAQDFEPESLQFMTTELLNIFRNQNKEK